MNILRRILGLADVVKPSDQKAVDDAVAVLRKEFLLAEKLFEDGTFKANSREQITRIENATSKLKALLASLPDTSEYMRVKMGTLMYLEDRHKQLLAIIEREAKKGIP